MRIVLSANRVNEDYIWEVAWRVCAVYKLCEMKQCEFDVSASERCSTRGRREWGMYSIDGRRMRRECT
jgi:hypothetical protein